MIVFFSIAIVFLSIIWWITRQYSYWKNRGIPYVKPIFPYGSLKGVGKTIHFGDIFKEIYNNFKNKGKLVGAYFLWNPVLIINDLDLIKNILIKDFNIFRDRQVYYNEEKDPLSAHLFSIEGQKWKLLRSKLSPTFTSGKMKFMFPTVVDVAERFKDTLQNLLLEQNEIEVKEMLARYTTDVIGSCAFGIECNSLNDPKAPMRLYGKKVFDEPRHKDLARFFLLSFPRIGRFFGIKNERDDVSEFFLGVVRDTIAFRETNKIRRNDFMDLLIEMQNNENVNENKITFEEIAAQAYIFYLAGFETSSTTLGFCLYELAINQDIQNKARNEILDILEKHNGQLTYEAVTEMTYLHKVIDETLRKYPPVTILIRSTSEDYKVPGEHFVIEKGINVFIPVYGIHHDPELYPNPDEFDPERFSPEMIKNRHLSAYLPFGEGPRNCIGLRFGKLQSYIGLILLLKNFKFMPTPKTKIPLVFSKSSLVLSSEGGLFLKVEKI